MPARRAALDPRSTSTTAVNAPNAGDERVFRTALDDRPEHFDLT
jgi:hypothetical protein